MMATAKKTTTAAAKKKTVKKKTAKKTVKKAVKKAVKKTAKKTVKKTAVKTAKKTTRPRKAATVAVDDDALDSDEIVLTSLSDTELNHFKDLLLQRRYELVGDVGQMMGNGQQGGRHDASGDLSSMPIHMADIGTDNYEHEFTLGLVESERKLLREIDRALEKIITRTYGVCEGTQKPINTERLEAKPWARYSIEYARLMEKGLAKPKNHD